MPRYQKDPIVEASITLQFEALGPERLQDISNFGADIETDYPGKRALLQVQIQSQFGPTVGSSTQQNPSGFLFVSADGKRFANASLTGFAFAELAPYEGWEKFSERAEQLWNEFVAAVGPQVVLEVGVRYVNHLPLPSGEKMEKYLRTYPEISPALPQLIADHFMRVDMPYSDNGKGRLTIQQGLLPRENPEIATLLLDCLLSVPLQDGDRAWEKIQALRSQKNDIFEACITDEMRARFK